ncbi:hypothetical protein RFI_25293 [Reticulomyxa filosa]|uniref:HMG box domain-containing protein n=1 Tax=Reticulomyxa filosa TaxID=46433 RepID=X6MDI1_RETFI|nr:hypothetical protein RFI_25293 [Reticulomyxa filosa]|eukprot:ETO12078.1 hypothetical protein RFI_25293 [Reticulomyxa filosa]
MDYLHFLEGEDTKVADEDRPVAPVNESAESKELSTSIPLEKSKKKKKISGTKQKGDRNKNSALKKKKKGANESMESETSKKKKKKKKVGTSVQRKEPEKVSDTSVEVLKPEETSGKKDKKQKSKKKNSKSKNKNKTKKIKSPNHETTSKKKKKKPKSQKNEVTGQPKQVIAYHIFLKERISEMKVTDPNKKFSERIRTIAQEWNRMNAESKQPFQDKAVSRGEYILVALNICGRILSVITTFKRREFFYYYYYCLENVYAWGKNNDDTAEISEAARLSDNASKINATELSDSEFEEPKTEDETETSVFSDHQSSQDSEKEILSDEQELSLA